jgi:hypothetical protein
MSEKEFEEFFDQEEVNKIARNTFGEFDKNLDNEVVDIGLKTYSIVTSTTIRIIAVIAIIVLTIIWCLLKGSFIRWMLSVGLHFIVSGALMITIYFIVNIFKNSMVKDAFKMTKETNLTSFISAGIISIIIGFVLIILYAIIRKTIDKKQKKAISNIQPIDYNAVQVSTVPFNAEQPASAVPTENPVEQPIEAPVPSPEPVQESGMEQQINTNQE